MAKKTLTVFEENKKKYDKFVKSLDGKTSEELLKVEKKLIKEIEANDKEVSTTYFELPADGYEKAATIIKKYLGKQTIGLQYIDSMLILMNSWPDTYPEDGKISVVVFDTTMTTLGQMQYTGLDEWNDIKYLNEYTKPLSDTYATMKAKTYLLAEEHSALTNKLQISDPDAANPGTPAQ